MAEIIMPKMGDAMTEGKVVRWYKKAGDAVKRGEPVLEIETDKVNLDLEAEQDGTVGEVTAQAGQMVPVGGRLATILAPGEKPSEAPKQEAAPKKETAKPEEASKKEQASKNEQAPAKEEAEPQRRVTDKKDSF